MSTLDETQHHRSERRNHEASTRHTHGNCDRGHGFRLVSPLGYASISGGRAFRLFTGRNYALNSLAQVLLEELHQQYTLSYYPTSERDKNAWRQIDVKVKKSGSQIRHRTGYYANQTTAKTSN